jgi:hypothetical protein
MKNRDLVAITSCIGKVAFQTYDQAKAVNERAKRGINGERRGFYRCPICKLYHIGHQSPTTRAKKRLRRLDLERSREVEED